ncbi:TIGR01777 family oxidoreductase [Leucobacter denitrificans]|uniref:TIGR01777 family protein n=1 Tax=Leucobacter denitrificans TaxID=683042 RepID=A0A7G9S3V8_9MICO|nr:TIGR01777 family oxidoreductase [Leucobacter denitrificans]QNN62533.1 TIGR01777 family protein [Leucobacter denitrificans]
MSRHIVIAGASGLIGQGLVRAATARGDRVTTLVRRPGRHSGEVEWDPAAGRLSPRALEGADAVVLLNGASVGRMPWTKSYREKLLNSRIDSTQTMVDALRELGSAAPMLVSGSAVGYYGNAPGEVLTETAGVGNTFLAKLCEAWEGAAREAETVTRVALVRTAPVIHRRGVLRPMITLTSFGLGGPLGRGSQIWPWISLEDEVRALLHVIDEGLTGPVNLCGPIPATANDIGRSLARELRRPFWLPAPQWGLKVVLGTAATESLLTVDADVRPGALEANGFTFTHTTAEAAVRAAVTDSS